MKLNINFCLKYINISYTINSFNIILKVFYNVFLVIEKFLLVNCSLLKINYYLKYQI